MTFASRQDAGQRLGQRLLDLGLPVDLVLGLPRGGVVVAAEVAHILHCPLDVLIVRKIGHPLHREFAVGALAEADVLILDKHSLGGGDLRMQMQLNDVIREETMRLREYQSKFHQELRDLRDKRVLIVDDGIATGATTEAAVMSAHKQGAQPVMVAVPVASTAAVERLKRAADEMIALFVDPYFDAVGGYYHSFAQTTDAQVLELLKAEHAPN